MNHVPRQKLVELVARFGRDICSDARRCEALLHDVCGDQHKREVFVLVSAVKDRAASELAAGLNGVPKAVVLARLSVRLHKNLGLTEELARWSVESWALALGIFAEDPCCENDAWPEEPLVTREKIQTQDRPASVDEVLKPLHGSNRLLAPAMNSISGTFTPGQCIRCGHFNPDKARFCEACGAGLFVVCPKCRADTRVGVKHCASCGVNVAQFQSALELLNEAERELKKKRTQEAIERAKCGLATGQLHEKFAALIKEAEAIESRIASLLIKARQLLRQADFNKVLQTCSALLELQPDQPDVGKILQQAHAIRTDHDARIETADKLRKDFRYLDAISTLRSLKTDYAWDASIQLKLTACDQDIATLESLRVKARATPRDAFEASLDAWQSVLRLSPNDAEAAAKIADVKQKMASSLVLEKRSWLFSVVTWSIGSVGLAMALICLTFAIAVNQDFLRTVVVSLAYTGIALLSWRFIAAVVGA